MNNSTRAAVHSFLSEGEPACTKPASKEPLPVLLKAADEV